MCPIQPRASRTDDWVNEADCHRTEEAWLAVEWDRNISYTVAYYIVYVSADIFYLNITELAWEWNMRKHDFVITFQTRHQQSS